MKITGGRLCGGQLRDYGRSRASLAVCWAVSDLPSNESLEENAICRGQSMQALTFFFAFVAVLARSTGAPPLGRRLPRNHPRAQPHTRGRPPPAPFNAPPRRSPRVPCDPPPPTLPP